MSGVTFSEVVVVGRDAALWLSACVLQVALAPSGVRVVAVELPSELQATDCYATQPALEALHRRLKLDEATLLTTTGGSFSLGQNFVDLSHAPASSEAARPFFHAYGAYGARIDDKPFLPHWLLARHFGLPVAFEDFSLTAAAAKQGRMLVPDAATGAYGRTDYGYHLPAPEYVRALKTLALKRGVALHEARQCDIELAAEGIAIQALKLDEDRRVTGQLFIDATGSEARLIDALGVGRESWRDYFAGDRVLHASAARFTNIPPYAEVRACDEGWVGLYPNQARTQVMHVYASAFCTDDVAERAAARHSALRLQDITFRSSHPSRSVGAWHSNCVAIGSAACTFDPIHCVDLHAVHVGLVHLLSLFPVSLDAEAERREYNRIAQLSFERIRDFQSAHYVLNRYSRDAFWTHARRAAATDLLWHKIETFKARGDVPMYENESFTEESWQALFIGHGIAPESFGPMVEGTPPDRMKQEFRRILGFIKDKVQQQMSHDACLQALGGRRGQA